MVKTDNHNPKVKLDLRRYFLRKYHADGLARVFDCCQGGGVMWDTLRQEFAIANYWGVDLKPKKGRLKIDSIRILSQGITEDVIDIDTYGSPWNHWMAVISKLQHSTTVFLTIGNQGQTAMQPGAHGGDLFMKFPPSTPQTLKGKYLRENDVKLALAKCLKSATIIEAVEAVSDGNARYIGVRLEPMKSPAEQVETAKRAKQRQPLKEVERV